MRERDELEDLAVDQALAETGAEGPLPRGRLLHHRMASRPGSEERTTLEAEVLKVRSLLRNFDAVSASDAEGDVSGRILLAIKERNRQRRRSTTGVLLSCAGILASAAALVGICTGWIVPGAGAESSREPRSTAIAHRQAPHPGVHGTRAPDVDFRARGLAAEVARLVGETVHRTTAHGANANALEARDAVEEVSLGIRALLAAGSTPSRGRHATVVHAALDWIEARLSGLDGTSLASALAACVEGAMSQGERLPSLAAHAERLAGEIVRRPDIFCAAQIPARVVADAGVSLALSAALGGDRGLAGQARSLLAAHLSRRLARIEHGDEGDTVAETWAAMLFAFPDLVRAEAGWDVSGPFPLSSGRWFAGKGAAARHLAWSFFPSEAHWSGFQARLLSFSRGQGGSSLKEVAALSLAVSVYHDGLRA